MNPMNDPFTESHGQRSGLFANGGASHPLTGPTTPQRNILFLSNHTPTRDPFAPLLSPHNLRVLLSESERLRMSLKQDLATAEEELESAQENMVSTKQDLATAQEEMKLRYDQIKFRDGQIKIRDNEIKVRDEEISKLQSEIHRLRVHIEKQDVTIRTQSRTIQDPRSLRQRRMEETSISLSATAQPWSPQNIQSLVGPTQSLSLGAPQQFASNGSDNAQYYSPYGHTGPGPQMSYKMSYPVEPTAPPMQFDLKGTVAGASLQGLFHPTPSARGPNQMNMNTQDTMHLTTFNTPGGISSVYGGGATAYAGIEFEAKVSDFGGRFRSLWGKIDQFGRIYVINGELRPEKVPAPLKEYMMLDPNTAVAVQYLNHAMTKPLCVAKVINFYLCKKMLKYTEIIKNLSPRIDGEILNAKRRMTLETPNSVRHGLLAKVADQMALARQKPNFTEFCSISRENHVNELLEMLEPLVTTMEDNNSMRELLKNIIVDAQKIGIDLFSCPYDARFHFPELNESYDPMVMVNLDPTLHANLVRARVGLSVTPYIRLGLINSEPARIRIVCGAKVFTRVPGEDANANHTPGRPS
uniref:ATP synthase subunit b n=1 Tax=Talaromyces marneffei PM1 TaxID=1077442 RepID=A0A093UVK1_TALMA